MAVNRSKHGALVANTVTTVDFVSGVSSPSAVELRNRSGSGDIYFRVDGTAATVGGDDTYIVLPGEALTVPTPSSAVSVSLISSGTPNYSVTGIWGR